MHAAIADRRADLGALCRRHGVARLEVFGSAARGADFDPASSDADLSENGAGRLLYGAQRGAALRAPSHRLSGFARKRPGVSFGFAEGASGEGISVSCWVR